MQTFPGELLDPTYTDPENNANLIARSEVERRKKYFERLESDTPGGDFHPLVALIKRCLNNNSSERPTATILLTEITNMKVILCIRT